MPEHPARPAQSGAAGSHRSTLGERGEDLAAAHLAEDGLEVVARNWRVRARDVQGELDVVALDHAAGRVVVCEVKTRRGSGYGGPLAAVTPRKQARIRRLALAFVRAADLPYTRLRFDVIGITWRRGGSPELVHVEGAF